MLSYSHNNTDLLVSKFIALGISYKQADISVRSLFSIDASDCEKLLEVARQKGVRSLFVLSTCNRTDIYAYSHDADMLIAMLVNFSRANKDLFLQHGYVKTGKAALSHLFSVAAGLDSQITGDYEIMSQLKAAVAFARDRGMIGTVMDRTLNFALQSAKAVRTNTQLSAGSVSVSFAAIEWIKGNTDPDHKKILLVGTGKFGRATTKNLQHYFPTADIVVTNRTDETARLLADELSVSWKPFATLREEVGKADIIIVCTNAADYTLLPHFFAGKKQQWVIDLSVPENVHSGVKEIPAVSVKGIDEISTAMRATIANRNSEIPKALAILEKHQTEFFNWLHMQPHVPVINDIKNKLFNLAEVHFCEANDKNIVSTKVNKAVGKLAMSLRYKSEKGCHCIHAINDFLNKDVAHG